MKAKQRGLTETEKLIKKANNRRYIKRKLAIICFCSACTYYYYNIQVYTDVWGTNCL